MYFTCKQLYVLNVVAKIYICRLANFKCYHRKFLLYKHNTLLVTLCYFNTIFPDLSHRKIANIFPSCFNFKIPFGADTEKETRSPHGKGTACSQSQSKRAATNQSSVSFLLACSCIRLY